MLHRFATFEIDEAARELRCAGRVLPLQPRVFDLLVYLTRNRDRVVPKDELLEAVWPGVIVTDGSLQRAVSLARSALEQAGAAEAIRTHARQGYRFRAAESSSTAVQPNDSGDKARAGGDENEDEKCAPELAAARAAYSRGDGEGAIRGFHAIDELEGLTAADLQRWAHGAQCAGRPAEAIGPLERAVAAYSARGDRRKAAWAAILLAQLRLEWREAALAQGWSRRAARLLEGEPACREKGYLDFLGARLALLQNDLETALELADRARATGEAFNDPDLQGLGLIHAGEASLYLGRIREGLAAIDEAGASVIACGLSPWAGGIVYCGVIFSCMTRADWQRAGQWTEQFTRWCEGRGVAAYPGLCRLHRAEVLLVRGRLREAERETRATIEMLARQAPWAEGDAWNVLGDILLARGLWDEARQAFTRATELGWEAQFGLALVREAQGDFEGAARLLGQAIAENSWSCRSRRGQALAHFAIITSSAGDLEATRRALDELDRDPDLTSTPALHALVQRARGELRAAEGDASAALAHLRTALRVWITLEAPLAAAQTRCRISHLLALTGDSESAVLELAAATKIFEEAGADGLLARYQQREQRS